MPQACGFLWTRAKERRTNRTEATRCNIIAYPRAFDGFTILQLSDLHVEMSEGAIMRLATMLPGIDYDLCVLTGDYRAQTSGSYEPALAGVARLCSALKRPIYGVLGNHDTIRMVPGLEDMGIKMLLNENQAIERGNQRIYLAGIDDAHFYRVDNIEKAATGSSAVTSKASFVSATLIAGAPAPMSGEDEL
jgi:uncharacterized protein